ncbi:MAG: tetratricopeptide repeat protein [Opitutaceae bacterium]|jgi:tetratricopeptide (TPR) repeat protein|nr:tetratricopeptide repeat protein [Opitutaceae bacterium]
MMNCLRIALLSSLLVSGIGGMGAAEPLFKPVPLVPTPAAAGPLLVEESGARRALAMGFPSVAAALYDELIVNTPDGLLRDALLLELAAARLDEGRVDLARDALAKFRSAPTPTSRFLAALVAVRERRMAEAGQMLASLDPAGLPANERGWWHYAQGLVAEADKDFDKAATDFQHAMEAAVSNQQRARFILSRERSRLEGGAQVTQEQLEQLEESVEKYQGRSIGYDYARQYAVSLAQAGNKSAALAFLQTQLASLPLSEPAVRDDYLLLTGLIAGASDRAGRDALDDLVTRGVNRDKQRVALQLLADAAAAGGGGGDGKSGAALLKTSFIARLDAWIAASGAHPILEDLYLARAEAALATQDWAQAEANAKALVDRFRNSPLKAAALMQLAAVSWDQHRYLAAASYAGQAREATSKDDTPSRAALGVLVAEAYYRAQDFRSAAGAYAAALEQVPAGVSPGGLIFQQVMSELESGYPDRLRRAQDLADRMASDPRFDPPSRWRTEWNLALALQREGRVADALARVTRLRKSYGTATANKPPPPPPSTAPPPPAATAVAASPRARLAWLEARLALDAGQPEQALELALAIPDALDGVDETLRNEIRALGRLLRAEALFALEKPDEAIVQLEWLRKDHPDSDAKMRSFIVEADYYARVGKLQDAQARLIRLADDYPKSRNYAPTALYQAALLAARRGQKAHIEEASRLLKRLVDDYPSSNLVFYAWMKQGDLAREINAFPVAQLAYETLINNYGQHADVFSAQLALAICHREQAGAADVSHYETALTIFERLRDLADPRVRIDLRVEAGFQLGDMLAGRAKTDADTERTLRAWWVVEDAFLHNEERAAALGPRGRYWMSRLLDRKAQVLEAAGKQDEARLAWQMIIDKGLPGARFARQRMAPADAGAIKN